MLMTGCFDFVLLYCGRQTYSYQRGSPAAETGGGKNERPVVMSTAKRISPRLVGSYPTPSMLVTGQVEDLQFIPANTGTSPRDAIAAVRSQSRKVREYDELVLWN